MTDTFDLAFQNKVVTMALRDPLFATRTAGLIEPSYFDFETHSWLVAFSNNHHASYKEPPSASIVIKALKDGKASKLIKGEFADDLVSFLKIVYAPAADLSNRDWTVDEVSAFARQRAMEAALELAIDVIDKKGDFAKIDAAIKKAQAVGANEGTGSTSFFDGVADRAKARLARLAGGIVRGITTGHREIDDLFFHKGWGRKEMAILMGGAKSGKSMGLQHFALAAAGAGYNVLYITLENSTEVTEDRMDAAMSGVSLKDLDTSSGTIAVAIAGAAKAGGRLDIHEFPGGACRNSDIRKVIERYKVNGIVFDMLVVDYADEMAPESKHNEERHAFKEIYQGLRAVGIDENLAVLTATQTNRAGNKATTATSTDVSEDFNKVRLADILITLNSTDDEKKTGMMRLYLAAMRNSEDGLTITCSQNRANQKFIQKVLKIT